VSTSETVDDTSSERRDGQEALPGVLVVHSGVSPALRAVAIDRGPVAVGRDDPATTMLDDDKLSRHHAEIGFAGGRWEVRDLGSRNGTFVDGEPVKGRVEVPDRAVVRAGATLLLLTRDVRAFAGVRVEDDGQLVRGPRFDAVLRAAAEAAVAGAALLVQGETGSGKEIVARAFHQALRRPSAPFVAVNCANIPEGVAERLLFGAKRGAYSGAMGDVQGYVQAAQGGVLFLDEIGELESAVQAKLLRVLETKEVMSLGSSTAQRVDVRFCCATHRDLRAEVERGRFRSDLYFRLGERDVTVPPLRDRREEIPWLVRSFLALHDEAKRRRAPHSKLVEACLLRPWPGNVRELARELNRAVQRAGAEDTIRVEHLRPEAGSPLPTVTLAAPLAPTGREPGEAREPRAKPADIEAALERAEGNVSAAARDLGLHRTQLRRLLAKLGPQGPRR
jgi:transcriptional regulator with PAS, ATPase and Fis domain